MVKNKIYKWMDQVKGLCQMIPKDMTFTDTAKMMIHCFWKTRSDIKNPALPTITNIKNPLEKPKEVASKVAEFKSNAKQVGLQAIRDLKLPGTLSPKKTEGEPKSAWPFDGFISKVLFFRKMGSKE